MKVALAFLFGLALGATSTPSLPAQGEGFFDTKQLLAQEADPEGQYLVTGYFAGVHDTALAVRDLSAISAAKGGEEAFWSAFPKSAGCLAPTDGRLRGLRTEMFQRLKALSSGQQENGSAALWLISKGCAK